MPDENPVTADSSQGSNEPENTQIVSDEPVVSTEAVTSGPVSKELVSEEPVSKESGIEERGTEERDTSDQEIVALKRQLKELRKTLASQDAKIAAFLTDNLARGEKQESPTTEQVSAEQVSVQQRSTDESVTGTSDTSLSTKAVVNAKEESQQIPIMTQDTLQPSVADAIAPEKKSAIASDLSSVDLRSIDLTLVVQQGFQAYSTGNLDLAGALYDRALELDPYNRDANLGVAAVATGTQNYLVAKQRYRHLLSLNPDDSLAFSALLNLVATTADSSLEHEMKVHVSQYQDNPALHAALGNYYSQLARWDEASNSYGVAVGLSPDTPDYLYNLAVTLDNLGDMRSAAETYQRAISLSEVGSYTFSVAEVRARLQTLQDALQAM